MNVELSDAQANSSTLIWFSCPYYSDEDTDSYHEYLLDDHIDRSSGGCAVFQLQENVYVAVKVSWDEVCDENAVSCLLLHHSRYTDPVAECRVLLATFLLVKRVENDQYQRVGIVSVDIDLPYGQEGTIFMDEDGKVLDEVDLSLGFDDTPLLTEGERRNICLI